MAVQSKRVAREPTRFSKEAKKLTTARNAKSIGDALAFAENNYKKLDYVPGSEMMDYSVNTFQENLRRYHDFTLGTYTNLVTIKTWVLRTKTAGNNDKVYTSQLDSLLKDTEAFHMAIRNYVDEMIKKHNALVPQEKAELKGNGRIHIEGK